MEVTPDTDLSALVMAGGIAADGADPDGGTGAAAAAAPRSPPDDGTGAAGESLPDAPDADGAEDDDLTLKLVEEEIRKAESLLSRNLSARRPFPTTTGGGGGGGGGTGSSGESAADAAAREAQSEARRQEILKELALSMGDIDMAAALTTPVSPSRTHSGTGAPLEGGFALGGASSGDAAGAGAAAIMSPGNEALQKKRSPLRSAGDPGSDPVTIKSQSDLQHAAADAVSKALREALAGRAAASARGGAAPAVSATHGGGDGLPSSAVAARNAASATAAATAVAEVARVSAGRSAAAYASPAASHASSHASTPAAAGVSSGNKYANKAERDALIAQLLADRKQRLASTPGGTQVAATPARSGGEAGAGGGMPTPQTGRSAATATPARPYTPAGGHGATPGIAASAGGVAMVHATPAQRPGAPASAASASRSGLPPKSRVAWSDDAERLDLGASAGAAGAAGGRPPVAQEYRQHHDQQLRQSSNRPPMQPQPQQAAAEAPAPADRSAPGSAGRKPPRSLVPSVARRPFSRGKLEKARREVEAERMAECTFKPKITPYASSKSSKPQSREERLARLSRPKSSSYEERETLRLKREIEEAAQCTFAPKINPLPGAKGAGSDDDDDVGSGSEDASDRENDSAVGSRAASRAASGSVSVSRGGGGASSAGAGGGGGGGSARGSGGRRRQPRVRVEDRLHAEAKRRAEQRAAAQREHEAQEVEAFPFKPSINPDTDIIVNTASYRPIHERIGDLQRAKNDTLQRLRIEAERSDPDLTFAPRISETSEKLAQHRQIETGEAPVAQRLVVDAANASKRREERARAWQASEDAALTFTPTINEVSAAIVADDPLYNETDFVSRQVLLAQQSAEEKGEWLAKQRDSAECTFKPAIGNAEAVLEKLRPERLGESREEGLTRLAKGDQQRIREQRKAISEDYYGQFNFQPQLNERSRRTGKALTPAEHVANQAKKDALAVAKAKYEEAFAKTHTFRPELVAHPDDMSEEDYERFRLDVANPEALGHKISAFRQEKADKIEQTRRALEYEQLKGCTFEPEVTRKPRAQQGPVVVRGLGRYLELKEMQRRLDAERAEREANAFKVKRAAVEVAEPFKLSTDAGSRARRSRAHAEAHAEAMKECTFHPRTMEGTIRTLMSEVI